MIFLWSTDIVKNIPVLEACCGESWHQFWREKTNLLSLPVLVKKKKRRSPGCYMFMFPYYVMSQKLNWFGPGKKNEEEKKLKKPDIIYMQVQARCWWEWYYNSAGTSKKQTISKTRNVAEREHNLRCRLFSMLWRTTFYSDTCVKVFFCWNKCRMTSGVNWNSFFRDSF